MKETIKKFIEEFSELSTEEQVAVYQEIKTHFKGVLSGKGERAEKEFMYIKDVFKSEFPL